MEDLDRWLAENVMGYTPIRGYTNWKTEHFHPTSSIEQAFMCEEKIKEMDKGSSYVKALVKIIHDEWCIHNNLTLIGVYYLIHASPLHRCQAIRKAVEG